MHTNYEAMIIKEILQLLLEISLKNEYIYGNYSKLYLYKEYQEDNSIDLSIFCYSLQGYTIDADKLPLLSFNNQTITPESNASYMIKNITTYVPQIALLNRENQEVIIDIEDYLQQYLTLQPELLDISQNMYDLIAKITILTQPETPQVWQNNTIKLSAAITETETDYHLVIQIQSLDKNLNIDWQKLPKIILINKENTFYKPIKNHYGYYIFHNIPEDEYKISLAKTATQVTFTTITKVKAAADSSLTLHNADWSSVNYYAISKNVIDFFKAHNPHQAEMHFETLIYNFNQTISIDSIDLENLFINPQALIPVTFYFLKENITLTQAIYQKLLESLRQAIIEANEAQGFYALMLYKYVYKEVPDIQVVIKIIAGEVYEIYRAISKGYALLHIFTQQTRPIVLQISSDNQTKTITLENGYAEIEWPFHNKKLETIDIIVETT